MERTYEDAQALTDIELLRRVATDGDAFRPLVDRHLRPLYRYVARRLGPTEAEDIVSEVFTAAFRLRDRFDPTLGEVRPWLFGIATRLMRQHERREVRMLRAYARSGVDPAVPGADESAHLGSDGPALARALAGMRREHREVLLMQSLGELSIDEIAAALGVPVGTVKSWLHRARAHAARSLRESGWSGDDLEALERGDA